MPILPLPQFEEDLKSYQDELAAEAAKLAPPKTLVVRFGALKLVGEFAYDGSIKPGCGSKVIARTHRGTEVAEVLTTTCPNSGCAKSVSRKDMLGYIEASGGKDYPFNTNGRVLRIATVEDLQRQSALEQSKHELVRRARDIAAAVRATVKIVDAEPLLGGERITFYYLSEERVDVRELHRALNAQYEGRVDLRQVGARDEARLVADYERCGQYCCCKNFLKVLKPISMRSAKTQKATLEPLKISGRCGRLMCCLRYEDETYEELRKRLPHKKTRVGTPHGDGIVLSAQILTQLVLVRLDSGTDVAVPVEELGPPGSMTPPPPREDRRREAPAERRPVRPVRPRREPAPAAPVEDHGDEEAAEGPPSEAEPRKKKRRRRKKRREGESAGDPAPRPARTEDESAPRPPRPVGEPPAAPDGGQEATERRRKRRRRRRRPGDGGGPESGPAGPAPAGG
ncbi:MAG TPA: regulatory iron-sulfur-containing complex subunit RicT [Phycisphaerales bacterium]|nr:regulatory iron-sulfur-containing complex subunit RicT [Phycisphaerales bacterium]